MRRNFPAVFDAVRPLFTPHAAACEVVHDAPDRYYLAARNVRATDGYRLGFGGVEIKKSYVSVHLIPVYVHPDLLDGTSSALRKRMQGKSCFNFTGVEPDLLAELKTVVDAGMERFTAEGFL